MHLQFQFALSEDDRSRIRMMVLFSNLIFLFNNVAFFLLNSSWFVDSHPYRLSCFIVITNFRFTHFGSFCLAF